LITFVASLLIVLRRAESPKLLQDSDTAFLLMKIREKADPLSWFGGDWPLQNHFYRPVSTLAFEWDNARFGSNAAGYGLTNALICAACVWLLFWFLRELTDSPLWSAGGAGLFGLWNLDQPVPVYWLAIVGPPIILVVGILRHRTAWKGWLPGVFLWAYVPIELEGLMPLYFRNVGWLPGRTATVMSIFALLAMAAYARYERLGARRVLPEAGPLDPPATRSTVQSRPPVPSWPWLVVSLVATGLALGSYEQAVMIPAVILGVGITMRWQGYQSRWWTQALFWGVLIGYLVLRSRLVPTEASGYQKQQFRDGPGVILSLVSYMLPNVGGLLTLRTNLDAGPLILLTSGPYLAVFEVVSNLWSYVSAKSEWRFFLSGYLLSVIAYLPMAWLKQFDHYHYWPMALRAVAVIALCKVAVEAALTAWSPPRLQAPPRLSPAPGSLPRP
jgi:hypothetical protein